MRVLLVGKGAPEQGGIPVFLSSLLESTLADEFELDFLNLATSGERHGGRLSFGNVRRTLSDAGAVWRRGRGHDLVHIHSAAAPGVTLVRSGLLMTVARARGARPILHVHGGLVAQWLTNTRRRAVAWLALKPASAIVAVSSDGEAALSSVVDRGRLTRIDNGVDVERFRPAGSTRRRRPRVLYVGLLTPRKGLLDLFEASSAVLADGLDHELRILGGVPDEGGRAEEQVRAAVPAHARLMGTMEHERMPSAYAEADIFCLPSWWEAMPLSVLEAMASGLPVVATDVGEVSRLVEHGVTGLVVRPHDPAGLADALRSLLADPERGAAMGAAARARSVEQYSLRRTVAAIAALYSSVGPDRRVSRRRAGSGPSPAPPSSRL